MNPKQFMIYNLALAEAHDHAGIFPMGGTIRNGEFDPPPDNTDHQFRLGWNAALLHVRKEQQILIRWLKSLDQRDYDDVLFKLRYEEYVLYVTDDEEVIFEPHDGRDDGKYELGCV